MSAALDLPTTEESQAPLVVITRSVPTILSLDKDDLLGALARNLAAFKPDLSTEKGRKEWASSGHSIRTTKTALIKLAKGSIEEQKRTIAAVNSECNALEEKMDALYDSHMADLLAWRQIEKDRVAANEARVAEISGAGRFTEENWRTIPLEAMRDRLREVTAEREAQWDFDFRQRAIDTIDAACFKITKAIEQREAQDAAEAEAERKRAEEREAKRLAAEQAQRDREARLQAEAAEKAREEERARAAEAAAAERQRIEQEKLSAEKAAREERERLEEEARQAEIAAQAEIEALEEAARLAAAEAEERRLEAVRREQEAQERAERAERARIDAEEKAERDRIAAAEKAELDRQAAVEAERSRMESQKRAEAEAAAARERDAVNRRTINDAIMSDLLVHVADLTEPVAAALITAVAQRRIRHMEIRY